MLHGLINRYSDNKHNHMAKTEIKATLNLDIKINLELTLAEAMALKEITGYGVDAFLKGYYKQLGKSYLEPHEKGVRSLFNTVKENLPQKIYNADKIIKAVSDIKDQLNP